MMELSRTMNATLHVFQSYLRRFRLDLFLWWMVSFTTSVMAKVLVASHTGRQTAWFGFFEILALLWIIGRLGWAEAGLATHGGWKQRPLCHRDYLQAQVCFALLVFLPPALFRALVLQSELQLSSTQWKTILLQQWLPAAGVLVLALMTVYFIGHVLRKMPTTRRNTVGRVLLSILLAFLLPTLITLLSTKRAKIASNSGDISETQLDSLRNTLPPDTIILKGGGQRKAAPRPGLRAQLVQRIPLNTGATWTQPGLRFRVQSVYLGKDRLELAYSVVSTSETPPTDHFIFVVRYADHTHALRDRYDIEGRFPGILLFTAYERRNQASFLTPQFLPWNRLDAHQLLQGAELLVYQPVITHEEAEHPQLVNEDESNAFQRQADAAIDAANGQYPPKVQALQTLNILGREALPYVLARHPWNDDAWISTVRPYLIRFTREEDQPELRKQLRRDPRMAEVFILKGWNKEALPELSRFAKERLPLGTMALDLLARQKDPTLTEDLAALAMRLDKGVKGLEPLLRQQPGFDWPKFAREGWRRWKYSNTYANEWWQFAYWAAQEGDASALRRLAEEAARGKKWEGEQLPGLIEGEHTDLLAFLRTNIDRLTFDPATRRYRLP